MRIRTIKPEFWENEYLSALPEITHLFAAALLNYADDDGYFNANPTLAKSKLFPIREPSRTIPVMFQELCGIGYLKFGVGSDGRRYGKIISFNDHQVISHPKPSKIKGLVKCAEDYGNITGAILERSILNGTGNREQGTGNGTDPAATPPPPPAAGVVLAIVPAATKPAGDGVKEQQQRLFAEMLQYLNEKSGRKFLVSPGLLTRIKAGATESDIRLVIEFMAQRVKDRPDFWTQYFDNTTPFRIGHFDKYRAAAEVWDKAGRGPSDAVESPGKGPRDRFKDHAASSPDDLARYGV